MPGEVITAVTNDHLRNTIAALVAGVWAVVALSTLITRDYTALGAVTPVMLVVVGFLFGYKTEQRKLNGHQQATPPQEKET
jgi:hypothetical protein